MIYINGLPNAYDALQSCILFCNLQGKGQGSAKGFKISSLNKLKDTQASEPGVTLLHHLLTETEKHNLKTLTFVDVLLPDLSYVCR